MFVIPSSHLLLSSNYPFKSAVSKLKSKYRWEREKIQWTLKRILGQGSCVGIRADCSYSNLPPNGSGVGLSAGRDGGPCHIENLLLWCWLFLSYLSLHLEGRWRVSHLSPVWSPLPTGSLLCWWALESHVPEFELSLTILLSELHFHYL